MTAENAFAAAHSQRLLFPTDAWREALARLDAGLGTREPFLLVTGEAGTGKTSLVLEAATAWGERACVAYITNPALTRLEFVEEIARRFGAEPPANPTKPQLLACLEQTLANVGADKVAVLVVDEAHQLDSDLLDELRLVVNSAAQAKRPFEAVLVGLPALDARLTEQTSLRQRVAVHCRLIPLSRKETRRYLHHRVATSGGDGPALFPRQTCNEVFDRTYGVHRAINSLAAEAIRVATAEGQSAVTAEHVQVAATRINLDVPARVGSTYAAEAETRDAGTTAPDTAPDAKSPQPAAASAAQATATPAAATTPKASATAQAAPAAASPPPAAASNKSSATLKSPAENSGTARSQPAPSEPKTANPPTPASAATPKSAGAPAVVATVGPSAGSDTDTLAEPEDGELAVTSALSVDMDPDDPRAKDWISRFVGNEGPPRIGSALMEPIPESPGNYETVIEEAPEPPKGVRGAKPRPRKLIRVVEDEFPSASGAMFESPVGARPSGFPRSSQDHRGGGRMGGPMFAIGAVVVVAVGWIVLLKGGELSLPGDTSVGTTHVGAADSADANAPADDEGSTAKRTTGGSSTMRSAATPDDQVSTLDSEAPDSESVATQTGPPKRMVIEVGTYIDAERARFERDQLIAETGLRVWVTRVAEYGSESYRVAVGTFPTEERAEASASYMLERGLVSEARVVELQPRKGRR